MIVTSVYELNQVAAPNLPLAPTVYEPRYQDQVNNVLRLYFNRLDAILGQLNASLTDAETSALFKFPNGAFHQDGNTTLTAAMTNTSTTDIQVVSTSTFEAPGHLLIGTELIAYTGLTSTSFTGITRGVLSTTNVAHSIGDAVTEALAVASSTSSTAVPFDATDASNAVALNSTDNTKIEISVAGYYNIQFSAQLLNFTTQIENVTFWFKHNGNDIAYSAGISAVPGKHGSGLGSAGAAIISWNLIYPFNAGDNFQLYFASELGNVVCATYPAGTAPVHPVSPSVILTATFVSGLY